MSSERPVFGDPSLLNIPTKRAAWSDRTALLMADMSKIAYYKFEIDANGRKMPQDVLDEVFERLTRPPGEAAADPSAGGEGADQIPNPSADAGRLIADLARAGFKLAGLFNDLETDTQAFLAVSAGTELNVRPPFGDREVAVLSFRGTENVNDWITNFKGIQKRVRGVPVHVGFQMGFDAVKGSIKAKVDPLVDKGRTLYLTGHSLGGALALIAVREIAPKSHGSCYTFGSPRVGRFGFARYIKTPLYRVVNSNDLVPRVPPAYVPTILLFVLRVLNVPAFGLLKGLIGKVSGYVHYGDMRFLRRAKGPDYKDLQVLSNPSVIYRFFWYWPALLASWMSPIKNHSIDVYRAKLAVYARSRIVGGFDK